MVMWFYFLASPFSVFVCSSNSYKCALLLLLVVFLSVWPTPDYHEAFSKQPISRPFVDISPHRNVTTIFSLLCVSVCVGPSLAQPEWVLFNELTCELFTFATRSCS